MKPQVAEIDRRTFVRNGLLLASSAVVPVRSLGASGAPVSSAAGTKRWNVLMVLCDGLSPDLPAAAGSNAPAMPNLRRLMARSTWFSRAYCDSPGCCPSRTAMLTGVPSARSGVYYNSHAFRQADSWIAGASVLPEQFRQHGYLTAGYGFIAHHRGTDEDRCYSSGHYRIFDQAGHVRWTERALIGQVIPSTLTKTWTRSWDWGSLPDDWDRDDPEKLQQDTEFANRTIDLLGRRHDRPFFATCGFWRPHVGWIVPRRYFDLFPLDRIELSAGYRENDLADLPGPARWIATHRGEHAWLVSNGLWKRALQGYYASVAYLDEQLGRVLDALERGPNRDNTIVVFTTDHGWHGGEKDHWSKFVLWEQACRVALAVSVPGLRAQTCDTPVSLVDLYPTLLGLCDVPRPATHALDGVDLGALLRGTSDTRGAPVINTYGRGNHAVRDEHFRYIRYRDGSEELYDHREDPHEWRNLAGDSAHAATKERLRAHLPRNDAPEIRYATGAPRVDANAWRDEAFQ
jgi:Arylsulfatase A and related enzymes